MTGQPGAPGSWNRDVHFALNRAAVPGTYRPGKSWGACRIEPPFERHGVLVTYAVPRLPWGRSTHAGAYLTHAVAGIFVAWRGGRPVGWQARWKCSPGTAHFRLLEEPNSPICALCTLDRTTQGSASVALSVGIKDARKA